MAHGLMGMSHEHLCCSENRLFVIVVNHDGVL
jgi:hypothetical protein